MSAPLCGVNENGQLEKSYIADGMPIGAVFPFYGTTPPAHTLACNGAAISRTAYAELFAVIGTTAGAGNGSTTFNVPDLRGMFIRGTGGNAAALGERQGDAIRNMTGYINAVYSQAQSAKPPESVGVLSWGPENNLLCTPKATTPEGNTSRWDIYFRASDQVPTAAENRPVNVAMTYCIVYEN